MNLRILGKIAGILLIALSYANAQTRTNQLDPNLDSRGEPELTVCSQNLANYGSFLEVKARVPTITEGDFADKERALVNRFERAHCDVIALQEIIGPDDLAAKAVVSRLTTLMQLRTNRSFEGVYGNTNDPALRNGFLVAKDRATIENRTSYEQVELPKLSEKQKTRLFSRGPFEVQLRVKGRDGSSSKNVSLITFHFKSRAGKGRDPAELEFETYRMEMAEALRRIVTSRFQQSFTSGASLLLLLGDRNSHFDTASAKILDGTLALKHFQEAGQCRISKRGVPLCKPATALAQQLFSVLTNDPQTKLLTGTFHYKDEYSWLDDILMPAPSLDYARSSPLIEGDYDSGIFLEPKEASDHALVYVRLNW